MKNLVLLFVKMLTNPKEAFKKYAKERLYFQAFLLFLISYVFDISVKYFSGKLQEKFISLLYLDFILLVILIYLLSKIFKGKGNILDTVGLLFLVNIPLIAISPFIILGEILDNIYILLVSRIIMVGWKLVLLVLGISIVHNLQIVKGMIVALLSLIITFPVATKLQSSLSQKKSLFNQIK